MKRIGFIGMGRMGIPISIRISRSFPITAVFNRTREKIPEEFRKVSREGVDSVPSEVDIIFMIVTDSKASSEILNQLINGGKCQGKIVVDMSTISYEQSMENHGIAEKEGVEYMDCPVIGSVPAAQAGNLAASCGGSEKVFHEIRDILKTFTARQIYAGGPGNGIAMKLVNNLIMGVNMVALSEGMSLSRAMGIRDDTFIEAVQSGGAASKILDLKGEKLKNRDFSAQFLLAHQFKDLNYAIELQKKLGLPDFMSSIADSIYSQVMPDHSEEDMSAVIEFFTKKKKDE